MDDFTYREVDHSYWVKDERIPGVTEILQVVGLTKNYQGIDPYYAYRGKAVHRAIELYLKGTLDESTLDPQIVPFFEGFLDFFRTMENASIPSTEVALLSKRGFAGTIDYYDDLRIIDWKCSKSHDPAAELQGEGYKFLAREVLGLPLTFRVVQFPGDGTYKIFDYGDGIKYWESVLKLYEWKTKKKGWPRG